MGQVKPSGRNKFSLVIGGFLVFCLTGCLGEAEKKTIPALRIGIHNSIDHLNVFTQSTTDFWKVQTYLFESLLRRDPVSGELVPNLAASWSWSKDKTSISFRLNPDLKWSDGKPLTVDDIIFTLKAHENPKFKSLYMGIFSQLLDSYQKLSSSEIRFVFHKPILSNLSGIGLNLLIYPKHIYQGEGRKNKIIASSGPFKINSFKVGKVLNLNKNPFWHGHKEESLKDLYQFSELEFHSSSGERELLEMINQGKIDFFQSLDPKQFSEFSKTLDGKKNVIAVKAEGYRLLGTRVVSVNHTRQGLRDLDVRKALMHCFDREHVNQKFFNNLLKLAEGPWPSGHPLSADMPESDHFDFDIHKANAILDHAGWIIDPKTGVRAKKMAGTVQTLRFDFLDYDKGNEPLLTLFKEAAKKIGVDIKINFTGFSEAMRLLKEKNFDLAFHQAQWTSVEPNLRFSYYSDSGDNPYLNVGGYKDEELDRYILAIENSFDSDERKKLYQKSFRRIARGLPELFWFHDRYVFYLVNKRVKRPQNVLPFSIGVSTWSIKDSL